MRILVVDDDQGSRAIVCRVARKTLKCLTDEASNGLECLEYLERRRYSLVVLDLQMPILDGLDTLGIIRRAPALQDLPVVILTGGGSAEQVQQAAGMGISAYLVKPVDPVQMAARFALVAPSLAPAGQGPERRDATVVVVCDTDPSFRRRTAQLLAADFVVRECDSGIALLRMLVDGLDTGPVHAILCGSNTGLVEGQLLATRVRTLPAGSDITMCVALPRDEVAAELQTGLWDVVMSAALPSTMFVASFTRAVATSAPTQRRNRDTTRLAPPLQVVARPADDAARGSAPDDNASAIASS